MTEPCTAPAKPVPKLCAIEPWVRRFEDARAHLLAAGVIVRAVDRRAFPPRYLVTLRPGAASRQDVLDLAQAMGWRE